MSDSFAAAIALAKDSARRRAYLAHVAQNAPEHGAARDVLESMRIKNVSRLAHMILAGAPEKDPQGWRRAQEESRTSSELLERDARRNSGAQGKALLKKHLDDATPVLLLLRAFELEARTVHDATGEAWTTMPGETVLKKLTKQLVPHGAPLMVVNRSDPLPPEDAAKLFAPADWHALVFCLIAEAKAVLIAVPSSREAPTRGLSQELEAVRMLDATDRAVIVLEPFVRGPFDPQDMTDFSAPIADALRKSGFAKPFAVADIDADMSAIVAATRGIMSAPV
jgi:hypothetical protein